MNPYKPKYFQTDELLPSAIEKTYAGLALTLIDDRLLATLDAIRAYFGKQVTVNNYASGGQFQWRCLRTAECPQFSPTSQHTFGRAADFDVSGLTAEMVRDAILKNISRFPFITAIEKDVTWVHVDVRNLLPGQKPVYLFEAK